MVRKNRAGRCHFNVAAVLAARIGRTLSGEGNDMEVEQQRIKSYSIKGLAQRWEVSPRTIHRWIALGRIPAPDIGFTERTKRFSNGRVEEIEQQHKLGAV